MPAPSEPKPVSRSVIAELSPSGALRAGINLSNFLLVTGRGQNGEPTGVSPDMAAAVADRLGVPVRYVEYQTPHELAEAAGAGAWDIGLIGAEPQRAAQIAFTAAYAEIEATYLVPAGSRFATAAEVDAPGVRIAVTERTAYGLWLDRNVRHAELVRSATMDSACEQFARVGLDALAGLRSRLLQDAAKLAGARILDGRFTSVQQAIGTPRKNTAAVAFLSGFVEEAKSAGLVARLIEKHGVSGLSVASPA